MPSVQAVREKQALVFHGGKFLSRDPAESHTSDAKRAWIRWPARLRAPGGREYILTHEEAPLSFNTCLYVCKKGSLATCACLELHAKSRVEVWAAGGDTFLSVTGYEREHAADEVQWVIPMGGDAGNVHQCERKLRSCLRRLSLLDREFRLGGSVKLYTNPDRSHAPQYQSKVEWLLGTDACYQIPKHDLHCFGIVPRRAMPETPRIDACFNELLAQLEAYTLPLYHSDMDASDASPPSPEISPLLSRMRCSSSAEQTVPPAAHTRSSFMSSMPSAST